MTNQYDRYLNRLRSIKLSRPEMKIYERNMQALSQPFNILNRKVAAMTQRGGASTAAQVAALTEGRNQWNQMQGQAYNQALGAQDARFARLDEKIADVELQRDIESDRLKKEKAAKRTGALRSATQMGGAAIGAVAGAFAGNPMMGAQIGSSIGQTVSGFMSVDESGNLSANPESWDTEQIVGGAQNAIASYSTYANEQSLKSNMSSLNQMMPDISNYIAKNPEQGNMMLYRVQQAVLNNDRTALDGLRLQIEGWKAESQSPELFVNPEYPF